MKYNSTIQSNLIKLKNDDWLEKQRVAGKITAGALSLLESQVKNHTILSLLELSKLAETYILDNNCTPTFKNYMGFPETVCISVNETLVHGIPTNYLLKPGDMIKFDLGATYKEVIADSAITCIFEPEETYKTILQNQIIKSCYNSLINGINSIKVGKQLGIIGYAINKSIKKNMFNVITKYGGHGICHINGKGIPHAAPFVANKAEINEGIRIQPGLVLAIEPMVVQGSTETYVDADKWSVKMKDNNPLTSHFEHTVYVHEDHVEILTLRENESSI